MNFHAYAGIGSRETPELILDLMFQIGMRLGRLGWVLRSGGAPGADAAFEKGALEVHGPRRIYLPRQGFGPIFRQGDTSAIVPKEDLGPTLWRQAITMAETLHPGWEALTKLALRDDATGRKAEGTMTLLTRNMFQVMGDSLESPVDLVVCYGESPVLNAQGSCVDVAGGTGQAVRLAAEMHIPVYNLVLDDHIQKLEAFLVAQERLMQEASPASTHRRRFP